MRKLTPVGIGLVIGALVVIVQASVEGWSVVQAAESTARSLLPLWWLY